MAKRLLRALLAALAFAAGPAAADDWTAEERAILRSLWIGSLPAPPPDPGNPVGDDPRAAEFGHRLFFDARLSANGRIACAGCHEPSRRFTDGRATALGLGPMTRNAPTLVGVAWNAWYFWDGRKDSAWSQALAPLESATEHGMTRARVLAAVRADPDYRRRYEALFGALPAPGDRDGETRAFANLGRALAAYERTLRPGPSRFDRYVAAVLDGRAPAEADRLTVDEEEGLRAFIDDNRGRCLRCHKGPLFADGTFHNIGIDGIRPGEKLTADAEGRPAGFRAALADEFSCLGPVSGAAPETCPDIKAASETANRPGAFKTPSVRNLARTAPYMHDGRFARLEDAIWHYRTQQPFSAVGQNELEPPTITDTEFRQIEAFLGALDGPIDAPARYLKAPVRE